MQDRHYRSVIKGISYRVVGTITTIMISFLITGKTGAALSIGMADVVIKVLIYYGHERVWNRIPIGRTKNSDIDFTI